MIPPLSLHGSDWSFRGHRGRFHEVPPKVQIVQVAPQARAGFFRFLGNLIYVWGWTKPEATPDHHLRLRDLVAGT